MRPLATLAIFFVTIAACGSSSSPTGTYAAVAPMGGITKMEQDFCAAERQRCPPRAPPPGSYAPSSPDPSIEWRDCLRTACERRVLHGPEIADAMNHCLYERPCGSTEMAICHARVFGPRASSAAVVHVYRRCFAMTARCGQGSRDDEYTCAEMAQYEPNARAAVDRCFDLPCALALECARGVMANASAACR